MNLWNDKSVRHKLEPFLEFSILADFMHQGLQDS